MARSRLSSGENEGLAGQDSVDGFGLRTFWWIAYVGAALVLLAVLLAAAWLYHGHEARLIERHLGTYSGALAQEFGNRTAAVRGQLKRWSGNPSLRAALLDGRTDVLRTKEQELGLLVPGALDVMVFSTGRTVPGGEASRRLSFAGLDMVQWAQDKGKIAPLEAHRVRQGDEHLAIAGPVMDAGGERVIGVVHIMLPMSLLPEMGGAADGDPHFVFRQQVGDNHVVIGGDTLEPVPSGVPSVLRPVADTRLELFAWASPQTRFTLELLPLLGGLYPLGLLLLGAALGLPARKLRRGVAADLASMLALAEDAAARRPLRDTRGRVRELVAATDKLRRLLRELAPSRSVAPKSPDELAALAEQAAAGGAADSGADFALDLPADDLVDAGTDAAIGSDPTPNPAEPAGAGALSVPAGIFRAYDIRGIVGSEINEQVMQALGRAVGSEAAVQGERACIVARDQRASGESLTRALVDGLIGSGCDVIDLGVAPSPLACWRHACIGPWSAR
jgi:phosphomannomutase/phosphoglucomutase